MLSLRGLTGRSELQALPRLVDALVTAGVAAVALGEELAEFVEAARQHDNLPVLILPQGTPFAEVERAMISLIIDREAQVQRRTLEIYQRLIQLALDDASMQDMAQELANAAGRVVYLENEYGVLQAIATPAEETGFTLPSAQEAPTYYSSRDILGISAGAPAATGYPSGSIRRTLAHSSYAVCSAPISLSGTVAGFLTLLGPDAAMQDLDDHIVARAASAFAVPIAKHRAIMETQTRLQGGFLESLFTGTFSDEEEISARGRYLGHDLSSTYRTACLVLDLATEAHDAETEAQRAGIWTSFLDLAHREILGLWPRALLRERGDTLAILLPIEDNVTFLQIRIGLEGARVRLCKLVTGATLTIGLGQSSHGPRGIVRSYVEAEQAARIARQFLGGNQTIPFEELGVYRVIARVDDRDALESFRNAYLGILAEYDARHSAELIETLEGFFACNGNHAKAAETLHLHRNTLLYRLERIETLSGLDLSDPETRLSLQLALKIRRVLPALQASQPRLTGGVRT